MLLGIYWFAPGTQSHLHVPETTRSGKVLIAHFLMTHTEPNLWKPQGGEVGQEKHTLKKRKKKVLDVKPLVPFIIKIVPIV